MRVHLLILLAAILTIGSCPALCPAQSVPLAKYKETVEKSRSTIKKLSNRIVKLRKLRKLDLRAERIRSQAAIKRMSIDLEKCRKKLRIVHKQKQAWVLPLSIGILIGIGSMGIAWAAVSTHNVLKAKP